MASTYSSNIRLEIMASGENDSTWGAKTSTNLQLLEAAIAGRAAVTHDDTANYTLTTANGSADEARRMILNIGGALGAARNTVCPTQSKFYVAKNATTGGFATTLKTSAGTGITIPNGKTMLLFCDGTNVVEAIDCMTSPTFVTSLIAGSTTMALLNTVATTINFAGAATTLNIGNAGGTNTVLGATTFSQAATLTSASPQLTLGVLNTTSGGVLTYGSTSGSQTWKPPAAAGAGVTITFPATTGTLLLDGGASSLTSVGTLTALNLSGDFSSTFFGDSSFVGSGVGDQSLTIRNSAVGTGNRTALQIGSDAGVSAGRVVMTSTTFTTSGYQLQDGMFIDTSQAGGISIAATHVSGDVRVYSRNALAATFGASQALTLGGALVGPATATVFNTVSTTVNAFGAASTALNIGHASGTNTFLGATTFSQALTAASLSTGSGAISGGAISGTTGVFTDNVTLTVNKYLILSSGVNFARNDTAANVLFSAGAGGLVVNDQADTKNLLVIKETAGASRLPEGIRIGADSTNNLIDDASTGAGTATLYIGNAAITVASDIRLKKIIGDTKVDALGIFNKLRVVDHTWDDPSDKAENNRNSRGVWVGIPAQDAIHHMPWLVNKPLDDSMWHVDYGYDFALTAKAFQQIDARLRALELNQK